MTQLTLDNLQTPTEDLHRMAAGKLETAQIGWITTIRDDGTPATVPVWFLWHDGTILVMSEPDTVKVARIRRGTPVGFHLESGPHGGEIVIVNGTAEISDKDSTAWLPAIGDAYGTKYADAIVDFGSQLEPIAAQFSTVILITPERISAW